MADASNTLSYDPYRIDSIPEIDQILLAIIKQGVLVHMHGEDLNQAAITTLIAIDFDNDRLIVDSAAQKTLNRQLIEAGKAYFSTQINQISIEFQLEGLSETIYENHPALVGSLPRFLRRIQRRDSFRVQPPLNKPATCTLPFQNEFFTLAIFDISAGGVSILDEAQALEAYEIPKGHIFTDCTLNLPGIGEISLDLELVRQQTQILGAAKKVSRYGCAFFNLKAADKIRIQNYIDQEERQRIARERGLA